MTLPTEATEIDPTRPVAIEGASLVEFLEHVARLEERLVRLEAGLARHERDLLPLQTFGATGTTRIEFDHGSFAESLERNRETIARIVTDQARRSLTYRRELLGGHD